MSRAAPATIVYTAWAPFFSGAERALLLLVTNLDQDRFRPLVVVGTDGQLAAELRAKGVETRYSPLPHTGVRNAAAFGTSVARLVRTLSHSRAGVVHANDAISFQAAGYASRLLRRPAISHVRFPDTEAGFRWLLKPGFKRAIFVSHALRSAAVAEAPKLFVGRSDVAHDGVLLPELPAASACMAIRAELNLPIDKPVIALTGQVSEVKGIWEFVAAGRHLTDHGIDAHYAVLGDDLRGGGRLREVMEQRVREAGLGSRFHFLGFREDAPKLVAAFDVVAVPSHVEPLGNATLEAMAAARPVVGSNVGGIPEMVVDGVTGVLVPPRDSRQLAEALGKLVRSPDLCRRYGAAGRERVAEHFSVRAHVRAVQGIYAKVLRGVAA